jgi:prephenate dehydratase
MKLACLGPAGTFGEEAARKYAPDAELVLCPSHAAVAAAVESYHADRGIVGIENSLSGSVAETLDILIHDTRLQIQAELVLPVVHNLVVKPGVRAEQVKVIFSHPAAPGQCRRFIESHFAGAQVEAALSTAEAVERTIHRDDSAAIANLRAAELYGAEVLFHGIQDSDNNVTRFVVLGHDSVAPTGRDRTSIAFTFPEDRPGALASVLAEFAKRSINCSKIESRPTREAFGEYVFLVDFEGHTADPKFADVINTIRPLCAEVKVFGSYPRWH